MSQALNNKGEDIDVIVRQISMEWSTSTDFDLAAAYEAKDGRTGLIYYGEGERGDLDNFPYMLLGEDAAIDDSSGNHKEIIRIENLDPMKYVWALCWDYNMVKEGKTARFSDSDLGIKVINNTGESIDINLDTNQAGNVYLIATIDNTSQGGVKLINESKAVILDELDDEEIMLFIKGSS